MNTQRLAFFAAATLAALTVSCAPARVGVYADGYSDGYSDVPGGSVGVYADAGPPNLAFESDPYLVPLPGTYAYGVPDYDGELYYAEGYYWRPWEGRWYRSPYYDRGWVSFSGVPLFYRSVPRSWRDDYYAHRWHGRSWDYARVPRHEVERNWSRWKRERRWDDDQRRYTGDRRWQDDRRQTDRRGDWDGRRDSTEDRSGNWSWGQREDDRREAERRGPGYGTREPARHAPDGRVYENREVERRVYDGRQPVERREIEQRSVERRDVERREIEGRGFDSGTREQRPVTQQRRVIEQRPAVQQRPAAQQRRTIEQRPVTHERRTIDQRPVTQERRTIEQRPVTQERRTIEQRPVTQERRTTVERREVQHDNRGQGVRRDPTPRGRGPVMRDDNRDGVDDSKQRPR